MDLTIFEITLSLGVTALGPLLLAHLVGGQSERAARVTRRLPVETLRWS